MKMRRSLTRGLALALSALTLLLSGCGAAGTEKQEEITYTVPESAELVASEATWELYDNGLFVFTGLSMPYISNHDEVPWFPYMDQIREVVITQPVDSISEFAFQDCVNLTRVTLPEGVERIKISAFSGCTALKSIRLPDSLREIEFWAFSNSGLEELVIPGMEKISNYAFQSCASLRRVVVSRGTVKIGFDVFEDCTSLEAIYLPQSVVSIGVYTFRGCDSLTDVYYGAGESDWNAVAVEQEGNEPLLSARLHTDAAPEDVIASA